jgi:hypothetical protein
MWGVGGRIYQHRRSNTAMLDVFNRFEQIWHYWRSTVGQPMKISFDELYAKVKKQLNDNLQDGNVELSAKIWLSLAQSVQSELDDEQLEALKIARQFRSEKSLEGARIEYIAKLSKRLSIFPPRSKETALYRLVFACLTANDGLSPFAAEFMIGVAQDTGIDAGQPAWNY